MVGRGILCAVTLAAAFSGVCEAAPKNTPTKYVHYGVAGKTAPEIMASLHSRGPVVYGVSAYASTYAEYSQKGEATQTAKSCKIRNLDYRMQFVIRLPKHKNKESLKGSTASAWRGFEKFVRAHEETHRTIWMDCAQGHAAQVARLSAASCSQVEASAAKLWERNRAACNKRHAAFDAAERSKLARQPLIRMAQRQ
jgi:predicted secreted Zn-dependent protease